MSPKQAWLKALNKWCSAALVIVFMTFVAFVLITFMAVVFMTCWDIWAMVFS